MTAVHRAICEQELLRQLGWVQGLARRLVGDGERARDVTQDVFRAALETPSRRRLSGPALRAWLRSATRFVAGKALRGQRRQRMREERASRPEATPSTLDVVARSALVQQVSQAVASLREPYRSTILYRYLDGMRSADIAVQMRVPAATVRKRLSRGLEMLRVGLAAQGIDRSSLGALFWLPAHGGLATAVSTVGGLGIMVSKTKAVAGLAGLGAAALLVGVLPPPAPATPAAVDPGRDVATRRAGDQPDAVTSSTAPQSALASLSRRELPASTPAHATLGTEAVEFDLTSILPTLSGLPVDRVFVGQLDLDTGEVIEPDSTPDGFHVATHGNGMRSAAGMRRNGKRVGAWSTWHQDGTLAAQGSYVHGKRHGRWTWWGTDGAVRSAGEYLYGAKEGEWTDADAQRRVVVAYRGGEKDGVERVWRAGGVNLKSETTWYGGEKEGMARTWYDNGQLESRGAYRRDQRFGHWDFWHQDGTRDETRTGVAVDPQRP